MSYELMAHDAMTYLRPKSIWLRPFAFVARCQNKSYQDLYENYNVRHFDIRVKWNKKTKSWDFAHGSMRYKGATLEEVLTWLNSKDNCIIRFCLEYNRPVKDMESISLLFSYLCDEVVHKYTNISFWCFGRKYDWKMLYTYKGEKTYSVYQAISSTTWKIIDDWWPWLYAKVHNKDNMEQGTNKQFLAMDFIGTI